MAAIQVLPNAVFSQAQSFVRYATRVVTDGVTATSTSLTSATAAFTSSDVGATVTGAGIANNTTIATVTNGTTVVLSQATTASASSVTVTVAKTAALAVPLLSTALNSSFGATAGNVQVFVDTTSGQTSNAVVDSQNTTVFSIPRGAWVGFNNGAWSSYATSAALTAAFSQYSVISTL